VNNIVDCETLLGKFPDVNLTVEHHPSDHLISKYSCGKW